MNRKKTTRWKENRIFNVHPKLPLAHSRSHDSVRLQLAPPWSLTVRGGGNPPRLNEQRSPRKSWLKILLILPARQSHLRWTVFRPSAVPVTVATVEVGRVEDTVVNSRVEPCNPAAGRG